MKKLVRIATRDPLIWPLSLFLLLPLLAFPEIIFGQQTLYLTDLTWVHYPCRIFAAEEWLARRVPLWDPYQNFGLPLLADTQVGPLYPLSALFLSPLSPSIELSLFILGHFTLAALFMFVLARSLAMSRAGATIAGLAFGFGGFLMAQVPNLIIMTGAIWLPLILFGVMQTVQRRSWLIAMLAGLPVALQIFTAQPQIVLYTLITISGYGLYRISADLFFSPNPKNRKLRYALHTGLLLTVAVGSGLLLAAPQLLPTLELQQLSLRSHHKDFGFLTQNSLPPLQLLNLLLPSVFGNNVLGFKGGDPFQEVFIYIGFIPLVLTFFSWGQRRKRDWLFFVLLLMSAIILALGSFTPIYQYLIQYIPGFTLFRIPSRWLMVVNFSLAILAGLGLETVLKKGLARSILVAVLITGLLLGIGLLIIWGQKANLLLWSSGLTGSYQKLATAFLNKAFTIHPIYQDRLLLKWITGLTAPAWLLITNLVITAILFILFFTQRITATTLAILLIIFTALDLTVAGGTTINPVKPASSWLKLSGGAQYVLEQLGDARVFSVGASSEELAVSHLGQCFPSVYRVHSATGFGSPLRLSRYNTFLKEAHPVQVIQILGVRYLLAEGYMGDDVAATYPIVFSDDNSIVHENKNPLPRAFVVHQAIQVNSPAEALAYFKGRDIDPRQTAILESETGEPAPQPSTPASASRAIISSQNPQVLQIQTSLASDGYLVLLDTYYPGWQATVDGHKTPIYRANYIGRAVFVPVGEHVVRFAYRPVSFRLGLSLSLLMLFVISATYLYNLTWKRRDRPKINGQKG